MARGLPGAACLGQGNYWAEERRLDNGGDLVRCKNELPLIDTIGNTYLLMEVDYSKDPAVAAAEEDNLLALR